MFGVHTAAVRAFLSDTRFCPDRSYPSIPGNESHGNFPEPGRESGTIRRVRKEWAGSARRTEPQVGYTAVEGKLGGDPFSSGASGMVAKRLRAISSHRHLRPGDTALGVRPGACEGVESSASAACPGDLVALSSDPYRGVMTLKGAAREPGALKVLRVRHKTTASWTMAPWTKAPLAKTHWQSRT